MTGIRVGPVVCHHDCNLAVSEAGQVFARGSQVTEEEECWLAEWGELTRRGSRS